MILLALLLSFDTDFHCSESGSGAITSFLPDFITESVDAVREKMSDIMARYGTMEFGDTGLELRISPYDPFSGCSKVGLRISF
ncbi:MAG: hypothetical protein R6V62_09470 [Candidatus Fermentibacteraceae bacterium]